MPAGYQPIEGSERHPAANEHWLREADADQVFPVSIRVKASAGQAGLDQVAAFARAKGLTLVDIHVEERIVVVCGTAAQMNEVFATSIAIYETPTGPQRRCHGHLHLPSGLATIIEGVIGLIEGEIANLEQWFNNLFGHHGPSPGYRTYDLIVPLSGPKGAVNPAEFSLVQQFDVGWLLDPGCQRMLDYLQASPVAFQTVRVMKVFTSGGTPELGIPMNGNPPTIAGGTVWPAGSSSSSISFTTTLNALAELTSRGLIPFVVLSFFPDGVYNNTSYQGTSLPTGPVDPTNSDWTQILTNWQTLVQAFFTALLNDSRFKAAAIANWWFEVWNEPDNPGFWGPDSDTGSLMYYQQLYQSTVAGVTAAGASIRLGGPAIMGPSVIGANTSIPGNTPTLMSAFIGFVTGNHLQCNFLSFHGKGSWSACLNGAPLDENGNPIPNGAPVLQSAADCADQTGHFAQNAGLTSITIINDEADMRANYDVPFLPRMTQQYAAWLTAMMVTYDSFSSEYAPMRFMAGSDNAELQLVGETQQAVGANPIFATAAFGQQRSIMTSSSSKTNGNAWTGQACPLDLLKIPAYNFYEILRLLGNQHGTFLSGGNNYYPHNSDLFHMITFATDHIGSIFCVYPPNPPAGPSQGPWTFNYSIVGISWPVINWYQFQIDGTVSNGFNAAGGPAAEPVVSMCTSPVFPATSMPLPFTSSQVSKIRQAQEFSIVGHSVGQAIPSGNFNTEFTIPAYTTIVFWLTENTPDVPATPLWATNPYTVDTTDYGSDVILYWQPDLDPTFYSYQVFRDGQENENIISPNPLRPALWVDTNPSPGQHTYWLRAVSASNVPSGFSTPLPVTVT